MASGVQVRTDYSAWDLRRLAATSKHANQSRRLLSLAAFLDGMDREQAARIGGMDRQTLRDWAKPARGSGERSSLERLAEGHRFNELGPDGLRDIRSKRHPPRLSKGQLAELAEIVETGPSRAVHDVVRWRRVDLKKVVEERFGVEYHERTIGKILKTIGFSHINARPRHPEQDPKIMEAFKKLPPDPERPCRAPAERSARRGPVPGRALRWLLQ